MKNKEKKAPKYANVGGQAVLEGVMMKAESASAFPCAARTAQ